jgi:hypothetical protein
VLRFAPETKGLTLEEVQERLTGKPPPMWQKHPDFE